MAFQIDSLGSVKLDELLVHEIGYFTESVVSGNIAW